MYILFENFMRLLRTKIGSEKPEKIVVVNDYKKNLELHFLVFCVVKKKKNSLEC